MSKRYLPLFILGVMSACVNRRNFSVHGTVATIERGKDGYTALLKATNGQQYDAVISRVNLADSDEY